VARDLRLGDCFFARLAAEAGQAEAEVEEVGGGGGGGGGGGLPAQAHPLAGYHPYGYHPYGYTELREALGHSPLRVCRYDGADHGVPMSPSYHL
jgi:hypothetical protein